MLRTAFGIEIPENVQTKCASEDFTQLVPTAYRADSVVEFYELNASGVSRGVVVETQLAIDDEKPYSWPLYVAALRAKIRAPSCLLVFCPKRRVADWARRSIETGHPRFDLTPLVIGPGTGPLVTTTAEAARYPEMTILATLANVTDPTEEVMEIAHAALATLDNQGHENAHYYTDVLLDALPPAAEKILEGLVQSGTSEYQFKSDFALRNQARGEVRGEAKAVLKLLAGRGLCVSTEVRERVLSCEDTAVLDEWLLRAASVTSAQDIFD